MIEMNFDQARFNMVEQQIRTWDVLDNAVLDLMRKTPREHFVAEQYKKLAYSDIGIPLGHGEEMLHPKIEAHVVQALKIQPTDTVLEIGTGAGYLTALLAQQARHVYSVDIHPDFVKSAGKKLRELEIQNVTIEEGDASKGWPEHGPYDAIAITGSMPELPQRIKDDLKVGGRLFVVLGDSPVMIGILITRTGEKTWTQEEIFDTDLKPLVNAERKPSFIF